MKGGENVNAAKLADILLGIGKFMAGIASVFTGAAWGCHYADMAIKRKNSKKESKEE